MAWTYTSTSLASSTSAHHNRAIVRLRIGDTIPTAAQKLDDAEIDYLVNSMGSVTMAAARAAESLGAKYASVPESKRVGDLALTRKEHDRLMTLSKELYREAASGVTPYVGGVSLQDKINNENDPDRSGPAFVRGANDYPGTAQAGGTAASQSTSGVWVS